MSWADMIAAGKAWNDAIRSRPGNPEGEKARKTWSSMPTYDAEEQALREAERERAREGSLLDADPFVEAFLAKARATHRTYWDAHPHGRGGERLFFDSKE